MIVIDNITGNYNDRELDGLIRIMLKLREKGIAVLFMTNKYNSMFRCANGAAVMRNGTVVFVDRGGKYTRDKIISIASAGEIYSPEIKKRGDTSRIVLEAAGVRSLKQPASQKSSFKLYKNEILGVCDDENENAADIVNSLLGNEKYTGSFFVDNREVKIRNFKTAVKNGIGVVSGDMINGVFYNMSIYDNITLMMPKKMYGVFGTINMRIKKILSVSDGGKAGLPRSSGELWACKHDRGSGKGGQGQNSHGQVGMRGNENNSFHKSVLQL